MLDAAAGEALRAWFAQRTGLVVYWLDQPEGYDPDEYAVLSVGNQVRKGQDGIRYEFDGTRPAGQQMVPTVVGQREFTLRVEVRSWSQQLDATADPALSTLEAALQLPSFQQLLLDLNLGLVATGPLLQTDLMVDERMQSRAAMDIRFATSIRLTDADESQSYIATADVQTTLQGGVHGDLVTTDHVGDV